MVNWGEEVGVLGLNLNAAYWEAVGGRYEPPASVRGQGQVVVTNRQGITKTYPTGDEAAKEWPTERTTYRRGGYFERSTRAVKRPPYERPPRIDPRYWNEQEKLMDEMYVDLR